MCTNNEHKKFYSGSLYKTRATSTVILYFFCEDNNLQPLLSLSLFSFSWSLRTPPLVGVFLLLYWASFAWWVSFIGRSTQVLSLGRPRRSPLITWSTVHSTKLVSYYGSVRTCNPFLSPVDGLKVCN